MISETAMYGLQVSMYGLQVCLVKIKEKQTKQCGGERSSDEGSGTKIKTK